MAPPATATAATAADDDEQQPKRQKTEESDDDEQIIREHEQAQRERYRRAHQDRVFDEYYDKLDSQREKASLLQQLVAIPIDNVGSIVQSALQQDAAAAASGNGEVKIEPFPAGNIGLSSDLALNQECTRIGLEAIRKNEVAAVVLAGGQGTRLGYDGPKGCYELDKLPSHKSLFHLIVERIIKLQQIAAAPSSSATKTDGTDAAASSIIVPLFVMTSPLNHDVTVDYFKKNQYFGLAEANVIFFQQGMLPCMTLTAAAEGHHNVIMESRSKVAMAPDGNGGIYPSLQNSGALADMKRRGCKYVHVFAIDNALVKPADPAFVGYCIRQEVWCGNKSVWKSRPDEKVGVLALKDAKPCVVEYSEITTAMAELRDPDSGQLVYGAGNICNHFFTVDFIENTVLTNMGTLYHVAKKKIPYYSPEQRTTVKPVDANNGIKLETFIFDVFPMAAGGKMAVWQVERAAEFAPVKNKSKAGEQVSDTPEIAATMISDLARQWVVAAGGTLGHTPAEGGEDDKKDDDVALCEISPLTSYAGEGLDSLVKGKEIDCPFSL